TSYSSSFFFQAEDGIRDFHVTGVQTCALPISSVREGELEQMGHRDRFRRARLDAQGAEDTAQEVDLVDEPVPLAGRHRVVGRVVGAPDVDAAGGAGTGA